ncbi:MAG: STAS-like domain-containing protein [Gammaproteobacteria bacterium]|nr:STAS-like domain-containing protein [Gammaproteobacteria bacterium]
METEQGSSVPELAQMIVSIQESSLTEGGCPITRSHAKRLLQHAEKFERVVFDFCDVEEIGPAFADELFRVFALQHPEIELVPVNANLQVGKMIARAKHHLETFLKDN